MCDFCKLLPLFSEAFHILASWAGNPFVHMLLHGVALMTGELRVPVWKAKAERLKYLDLCRYARWAAREDPGLLQLSRAAIGLKFPRPGGVVSLGEGTAGPAPPPLGSGTSSGSTCAVRGGATTGQPARSANHSRFTLK